MTKERQTQIMKPIKVLSLVLLALLLLVPAASAETYTIIDEDLEFTNSGSLSPGVTNQVSEGQNIFRYSPSSLGLSSDITPQSAYIFSAHKLTDGTVSPKNGAVQLYGSSRDGYYLGSSSKSGSVIDLVVFPYYKESAPFGGSFPSYIYLNCKNVVSDYTEDNPLDLKQFLGSYVACTKVSIPYSYDSDSGSYDSPDGVYALLPDLEVYLEYYSYLYPNCYILCYCSGGYYIPKCYAYFSIVALPLEGAAVPQPTLQHVTVTYTEESENYQIYVDTSDESVDVWVHGYLFGWFPVYTFSSNSFPPSTHFEWLDLPFQFMLWNIDWEVKVECNGESQILKWNQDSLPIEATPPDPDPPINPDPPDEPDPPDPTEPPEEPPNPPWYNPSGGEGGGGSFDGQTFRETFKLPESLLDLLNFDLKQIRSDLLADIPIFEDVAVGWFDATDGLQNVFFGFIAGILVTFFKPLTDLFEWIADVIEWFYNLCFGFTDYLYIPNHILSYLVQFVPNEILNLAAFLFALDVVVALLSILIPDIRYVYNVAVSYAKSRIPVRDTPPSQPYLGTELDVYHSEYWGDSYIEGHDYDYHQDVTEDGLNYEWRYK